MFEEEIALLKRLSENYADEIDMDFGDGASPEEIAVFEQKTGVTLPEEVSALYSLKPILRKMQTNDIHLRNNRLLAYPPHL